MRWVSSSLLRRFIHERARLREALEAAGTEAEQKKLRLSLSELEQKLSMRLESLRSSGTL